MHNLIPLKGNKGMSGFSISLQKMLRTYLSNILHKSVTLNHVVLFISGHTDCYPPVFSKYFNFISSFHSYATRQSCNRNLYVASVNTTQYGLRSLKFTGPRLWNSLLTSTTNSISLRVFCKTLKDSMLNCYSN